MKQKWVIDKPYLLEAGVGDVDSAIIAARAGVHRIELFANFPEGGTTPSEGTLRAVLEEVTVPVMVMIRPRGGDFIYGRDEFRSMCYDVEMAHKAGAYGIVFGCLTTDGRIDEAQCRTLLEIANGMDSTFHRAFDLTPHLMESIEVLIKLGIRRVLTSGGRRSATEGMDILRKLQWMAGDRISIMPGGGVRSSNILELAKHTACREFHLAPVRQRKSSYFRDGQPEIFYQTHLCDTHELFQILQTLNQWIKNFF